MSEAVCKTDAYQKYINGVVHTKNHGLLISNKFSMYQHTKLDTWKKVPIIESKGMWYISVDTVSSNFYCTRLYDPDLMLGVILLLSLPD
jgi:hypothetical protein